MKKVSDMGAFLASLGGSIDRSQSFIEHELQSLINRGSPFTAAIFHVIKWKKIKNSKCQC